MYSRLLPLAATLAFSLAVASPVAAQPSSGSGALVSGFLSGSFGDGGTSPGFGVSAGYRFNRHFGFEFDVSYVSGLRLSGERQRYPGPLTDRDLVEIMRGMPGMGGAFDWSTLPDWAFPRMLRDRGNLLTFTANYVVEIPTGVRWLRPYFLGGGGVGNLSRHLDFWTSIVDEFGSGVPWIQRTSRSETSLVLDAGGGVDFQVARGLAVGGDVRYFHLFSNLSGIDRARVGVRVSYRF